MLAAILPQLRRCRLCCHSLPLSYLQSALKQSCTALPPHRTAVPGPALGPAVTTQLLLSAACSKALCPALPLHHVQVSYAVEDREPPLLREEVDKLVKRLG